MNEKEYRKLCEDCFKILNIEKKAMAVSFLHVLKEHPESLKQYLLLYNKENYLIKLIKYILLYTKVILINIFRLIMSFIHNNELWYSNTNGFKVQCDLLLVTHLINKNQLNNENDFFFGDLENYLKTSGFKVGIIFIDHIGIKNKILNLNNKNIYILPSLINFRLEMKLLKKALSIKRLIKNLIHEKELNPLLIKFSAVNSIGSSTLSALRIEYQVTHLMEYLNPKGLIFTYEGHSWERLLSLSTKVENRNIVSIGYQHNYLTKLQNSSLRSFGAPFDPDCIFVSGLFGKIRFSNSMYNTKYGIELIGSNRVSIEKKNKLFKKQKRVLVIPEGLNSECEIMFKFSRKCADLDFNIKYLWRLHPALTKKYIINNSLFKNLPENITLSSNSLESDVEYSTHVLYRGSTAVINAIKLGLKPIYLNIHGELEIDVLHGLNNWKEKIHSPIELIQIIHNDDTSEDNKKIALSYIDKIYCKQSKEAVKIAIDKIFERM